MIQLFCSHNADKLKKILICLFCVLLFSAKDSSGNDFNVDAPHYIAAGMRQSRFANIEYVQNGFGIVFENSVFIQHTKLQYFRFLAFYETAFSDILKMRYSLFMGMRYNRDYFNSGSQIHLAEQFLPRFCHLKGSVQFLYDSEMGHDFVYDIQFRSNFFRDISLLAGLRTIPEYRAPEKRLYAGLSFDTPHLSVQPEISTPYHKQLQLTRVSISFLYNLPL